MNKQHSKKRRQSTAVILLICALIFTVITILSFVNKESLGDIIFNVSSTLICYSIALVLLFNKEIKENEKKQEERDKNFRK